MTTRSRLILVALLVMGITGYLAYVGASGSWQYYLTAEECLTDAQTLVGSRIRATGTVAADSLEIDSRRQQASFSLEAPNGLLAVQCSGPLPDNLAEGIDVVVEGRLERPDLLRGTKVLTRCDSKYESRKSSRPPGGTAT